jgi:hypothetical protein
MSKAEDSGQVVVDQDKETGDWYATFICPQCNQEYELMYLSRASLEKSIAKRTVHDAVHCLECLPSPPME